MRLFVAIYIVPGAKDMLTIVFRSLPYWHNAKMSRWIASSKDCDTICGNQTNLLLPLLRQQLTVYVHLDTHLDCEQFLFFFRFSKGSACRR